MSAVSVLQPPRQSGSPGYSAYQLAVQGGFVGTQAQWIVSLKGAPADLTTLNAAVATAATSANSASGSATAAFGSMTTAAASAQAAGSSATAAGSAVNAAANQAANAGTSATAALNAAGASAGSAGASANSATLAQAWAMQVSGTVDGASYSARFYAQLSAAWASQATGTVDGTNYSAKYYALQAAQSAAQAAGAGITPSGAFTVGHFLLANSATGGSAVDGGAPAAVATSGSASDLKAGTLPSAQAPVLSGDVTTTAGSAATTIAANAVTNAKAAQMAAGTLKGNITGGAANATDSSISAVLDALLGNTPGYVAVRGASAWGAAAPAPVFPVTGTSAKSAAYTLGSTAGDTGKVFTLTGSFALTVPLASGGSTATPLYYHYSKRDGSGVCTTVLSGSDTWEDGTTAAKSIYQETGTLVSVGSGVWRFAPGTRQRGWVDAGAYTATAGASALSITLGAGDADIRDVEISLFNFVPGSTVALMLAVFQAGTAGTFVGGYSGASSGGAQASTLSGTSISLTLGGGSTGAGHARILLQNIQATAAYGVAILSSAFKQYAFFTDAVLSTTGAVSSITLSPSSGTLTAMPYNVRVYRP